MAKSPVSFPGIDWKADPDDMVPYGGTRGGGKPKKVNREYLHEICGEIRADPKILPYVPAWSDSNLRDFDAGIRAAVAVLIQQGKLKP